MSKQFLSRGNKGMMTCCKHSGLVQAITLLLMAGTGLTRAWAQDSTMPSMDHGAMDHGTMSSSSMPGMNHGAMSDTEHENATPMSGQDMNGMHDMDGMQGGSAPADARDPRAYSGGHTLDSGPYDLPGSRQLRLADEHYFAGLLVDRLEHADAENSSFITYDLKAWLGRDYDRLVLETEGDVDGGKVDESATELLWSHAVASFWNARIGARVDTGEGPDRSWLAAGFEGLAPYWFEVDAAFYVGENSRTAFAVEAEYELLLTQKLVLQPRLEAEFFGKSDLERELGSGLSEASAGLRLRYEFVREFAPYVGIEWAGKFGGTADYARDANVDPRETRVVGGVRFWL